uniref:VENT homeobox n=1 Tax=Gopherus evgoodei TaxID=1825980 RepID=A0A8C4YJ52_9SAUR
MPASASFTLQPPTGSGRSECLSPEEPGGRGSRRLRTAFSVEQISTLESSFKRHKYLGSAERRKLAAKMQLSEVQIKTWFQNRRMKLKRQLQEMRPEPFYSPVSFGAVLNLAVCTQWVKSCAHGKIPIDCNGLGQDFTLC